MANFLAFGFQVMGRCEPINFLGRIIFEKANLLIEFVKFLKCKNFKPSE
jgi:hypothetical protein